MRDKLDEHTDAIAALGGNLFAAYRDANTGQLRASVHSPEAGEQPMEVWHQVKLHYIGLLVNHHQPELAETFYNSVTTKILHRAYFHNDFIFVRPAVSTEYIENDESEALPTYRAYYPAPDAMPATWRRVCATRAFTSSERPAKSMRLILERISEALAWKAEIAEGSAGTTT